jgi:hypothetical protein
LTKKFQTLPTLSERDLLDRIRAGPYYSVRFTPGDEKLDITKARLKEIVAADAVRLRGWDFPSDHASTIYTASAFVGSYLEFNDHVEAWRFYASGQFLYFANPWDVFEDLQARLKAELGHGIILPHPSMHDSISGLFSFVGMIYSLTEFHLWASRVMATLSLNSATLQIAMHNIDGWALASGEPLAMFVGFYQAHSSSARLRAPMPTDLSANPVATANAAARELFEYFSWSPSEATIRQWQDRLIAGRLAY